MILWTSYLIPESNEKRVDKSTQNQFKARVRTRPKITRHALKRSIRNRPETVPTQAFFPLDSTLDHEKYTRATLGYLMWHMVLFAKVSFFQSCFFGKGHTEQHWLNQKGTGWPSVAQSVHCQSLFLNTFCKVNQRFCCYAVQNLFLFKWQTRKPLFLGNTAARLLENHKPAKHRKTPANIRRRFGIL